MELRTSAGSLASKVLRLVQGGQRIAVDRADAIFNEYFGALSTSTRADFASKLVLRLFHLRYSDDVCHRVDITPIDDPPGSFAEVPAQLQGFDRDDQKFIAVAAAEGGTPPLFAGVDSEWWLRRVDFAAVNIDVQFPCVADLI